MICASSVGRQGGAQLLHLGPACTRTLGTPLHELMHALGFFHEHMRPDRDRYVYINYSNIDEGNFTRTGQRVCNERTRIRVALVMLQLGNTTARFACQPQRGQPRLPWSESLASDGILPVL